MDTIPILLFTAGTAIVPSVLQAAEKPNYIIIYCDDLGYGDLGCYGNRVHRTPNIDALAGNGIRFTDFYVACSVSTPSRAALLTGCYPRRVGLEAPGIVQGKAVLFPGDNQGLNPQEMTIGKMLQSVGYSTACIGKWHLGDQPEFMPWNHGFDYYYGLPYSNDMGDGNKKNPPLPLMENERVVEAPAQQTTLTQRYTQKAVEFITENSTRPFFVYLPHSMPHNPVNSSENFRGKSANGGYGDAVEEIDWSVGELVKTLTELGILDNTLIIFSSDNGAASAFGGTNNPLRGFKSSDWEGGFRTPMIVSWPGTVSPGECSEIVTNMDLLPSLAALSGANLPKEKIDGQNILPVLLGKKAKAGKERVFYYYYGSQLQAVRVGDWKLHLPLDRKITSAHAHIPQGDPYPGELFNMKDDAAETVNVFDENPKVVSKLSRYAQKMLRELGDLDHPYEGNIRPAGYVDNPVKITAGGLN